MNKLKIIIMLLLIFVFVLTSNVFTDKAEEIPEDGLMLWFKADALDLEDGDFVDEWIDSSGNDYHAKALDNYQYENDDGETIDLRPVFKDEGLNGLPVLKFHESYLITQRFMNQPQPNTIFILFKLNEADSGDHNIIDGRDDGGSRNRITFSQMDTDPGIVLWSGGSWPPDLHKDFYVPSEFNIVAGIYDGSRSMLMIGQEIEEGEVADNTMDGLTIGGRAGGTGQYIIGKIAEIIVYNRSISRGELMDVQQYLHNKWFE